MKRMKDKRKKKNSMESGNEIVVWLMSTNKSVVWVQICEPKNGFCVFVVKYKELIAENYD